ncbi:MAG: hypothetical protein ACJ8AO_21055, partial [Gemmatimonadaceae bacterium]
RPGAGPARAAAHDPVLDTALYAVIPFHSGDGSLGARAALHLYDALAEWDGLRLVRTLGVNDAMAREGGSAALRGPDAARRVARALGAGRAVFGNVSPDGDSLRVDAVVYDAASGRGLQSAKASVGPDLAGAADAFAALARQLLASVPGGPPPATAAGGTRSLPAWRAYERGHLALRDWDVDAAADAFAEATAADPDFARAQLWLAQSSAWRNGAPGDSRVSTEERAAATRAAGLAGRLPKRDRALAAALLALAERRFPLACEGFRSLVAADSLDFAGWYGLGLCQWRDDAVVRSTRSRSGWAFRSSFHGAAAALLRAMRVAPSFQRAFRGTAAERLGGVLVTDAGVLREGHGPAREVFYAYPGFEGDTLVYVPWPVRAFAEGRRETVPASYGIALERNRRAVRTILSDWARAFPRSLPAQVALAHALEATGEIRDARGGDPSALEAYGRALALAAEPRSRVALAQDVARIHLKRGEHARARALADSLLRAWPDSLLRDHPQRANIVDRLAGLAVLTGRGRRAAAMRAMAAAADTVFTSRGERVLLPPELAADAARLRVFSALGAPADSIRTVAARVEARLRSSVEPERRDAMREAALTRSLSLAVSAIGLGTVRGLDGDADILVRMQQALERGDTAALRRTLGDVDGARRALPPGTVPIDATFHEAWLLLAAGDTAAAVRRLDGSLGALSALGPWVTVHVSEAAALVRAMALRADLAALAGDAATARQWATPVATLWADADPELQPLVARMRALAR